MTAYIIKRKTDGAFFRGRLGLVNYWTDEPELARPYSRMTEAAVAIVTEHISAGSVDVVAQDGKAAPQHHMQDARPRMYLGGGRE